MNTAEDITVGHRIREGTVPSVKAIAVENYLYLSVVDPETNEAHDLLFSRTQWEVAKDRAARRHSILPFISPIAPWKAWILRLLGFQFI